MKNTFLLLFSLVLAAGLFSCTSDPDMPEPPVPEPKLLKEFSTYNMQTRRNSLCYGFVYDNQGRTTRLTRFSIDSNATPILRDTTADFHFTYDGSATLPSGYVVLRQGYSFLHLLYYDAQNRPSLDSCKSVTPAFPSTSYNNLGSSIAFSYNGNRTTKIIRNFPGRADRIWGFDTLIADNNGNITEQSLIMYSPTSSVTTTKEVMEYGTVANPFQPANISAIVIGGAMFMSKNIFTKYTSTTSSTGGSGPSTSTATYEPFLNANGQVSYCNVLMGGAPAGYFYRYTYYE
ncbi:MAG: hypothetical protein ABW019_14835 [Chitinophagaceae bacterium]